MSQQVSITDREQRLGESALKIQDPFTVDPTLCLYSPQDNVDSLQHPRVADWIEFVANRYEPELPDADRKILLFMPCTKTKPYPFSSEHKTINNRLSEAGFRPIGRNPLPQQLQARLEDKFTQDVLDLSLLSDGKGTIIHRMVISEPMALVPYEHIMSYEDKQSPAVAYDDPGLFENRGNAVSPWREDSTASPINATRWRWGDNEKRAYVEMHNAMAKGVADALLRIGDRYTDRVAWVAPGLTHRSFVLAQDERKAHGVVSTKKVGGEALRLEGINDILPDEMRIECLPLPEQCDTAKQQLADRLGVPVSRVGGAYSRGGANATPLALPELLDVLVKRLVE